METYWTKRVNLSLNDEKNLNSTISSLNRVRLENARQLKGLLSKLEAKYPDFKDISQNQLRLLLNKTSLGQDIYDIQKTIAEKQLRVIDSTIRENIKNHYIFNHNEYLTQTLKEVLPTNTEVPFNTMNCILTSDINDKSYSSRLYSDTLKVSQDIKTSLLSGVQQGLSIQEMATQLSHVAQISFYNARRIVATEDTFYTNQSDLQDYKDLGIEEYEFASIMDSKTSEICRSLDGKKFKVSEGQVGVNLPPMHPNCRSTTLAVFGDITKAENQDNYSIYKNEVQDLMNKFGLNDAINFKKTSGRSGYSFNQNTFSFGKSVESDYLADSSPVGLARHEFAHYLSNKLSKEAGVSVEEWSKNQLASFYKVSTGGKIDLSYISPYAQDSSRWSEGFAELFSKTYKDGGSAEIVNWVGGRQSVEFKIAKQVITKPFQVVKANFSSEMDAIEWIENNNFEKKLTSFWNTSNSVNQKLRADIPLEKTQLKSLNEILKNVTVKYEDPIFRYSDDLNFEKNQIYINKGADYVFSNKSSWSEARDNAFKEKKVIYMFENAKAFPYPRTGHSQLAPNQEWVVKEIVEATRQNPKIYVFSNKK